MLKPIQPHDSRQPVRKEEPTIRIGRKLPDGAVNMAYYYNPTATDAEKILSSEAPRNTIDHRVEEEYRYLFDQASDDDNLFPKYVEFKDEEGYAGRLGRMYVNWYPEAHIETKSATRQEKYLGLHDKSEVPAIVSYDGDDGYSGSLYLDTAEYAVSEYKTLSKQIPLDYTVQNHELNYTEIFGGKILDGNELDAWLIPPGQAGSKFPTTITVGSKTLSATDGLETIRQYVNAKENPYFDENGHAMGTLKFKSIEYEPVDWVGSTGYSIEVDGREMTQMTYSTTDPEDIDDIYPPCFQTYYSWTDDTNDTSEIDDFKAVCSNYGGRCSGVDGYLRDGRYQVTIYRTQHSTEIIEPDPEEEEGETEYIYRATYSYTVTKRGKDAQPKYNVVCNYSGTLQTGFIYTWEVPWKWDAVANYVGLVRLVWYDYDGAAYYRGAVTKGTSVGNVNPEGDNEILMFPDKNGYLRTRENFYNVEADLVYITDVFKDGKACFYKYPLKKPIYDYRGPDSNGFYDGNAISVRTNGFKELPGGYAYNMKLEPEDMATVDYVTDDFQIAQKQVPRRYKGVLYTSFISDTTDTFKCTYNAFNDSDGHNTEIENGVTEDVYPYPFYLHNVDYKLYAFDEKARVNRIKLMNPGSFKDTRQYVTFTYTITAERTDKGVKFTTEPRTASILNREYALSSEHDKFINRAMVISPTQDGVQLSPFDIVLRDQASRKDVLPVIKYGDTDFVFYGTITRISDGMRGAVNIFCNPDGSGLISAETTVDTGFYDEKTGLYNKKLSVDNEYILEEGYIHPGYKVMCVDARKIKVAAPREDGLLDSWHPIIQFGHYSQVLDQYGVHTKVCYTMPEYDKQHFSTVYGKPYVEVEKEQAQIINSHMIKVKCYPLLILSQSMDDDTYLYQNKLFKVIKESVTWKEAQDKCRELGGNLAMPKSADLGDFISGVARRYEINGLWLGATDEEQEGVWKWIDGTAMTYTNWNVGEPNNVNGNEHYLETYTSSNDGKWNDLPGDMRLDGYICQFDLIKTVSVFREMDGELFSVDIRDISFSDGVIITDTAISLNDNILVDYVYLEENYVYRGFWRQSDDYCRLDLNPNIYHTYSDMTYSPSEIKPSKNLFNKVIYFFMKPRVVYEIIDREDSEIEETLSPDSLREIYQKGHRMSLKWNDGRNNFLSNPTELEAWVYDETKNSFLQPMNTTTLTTMSSLESYPDFEIKVRVSSTATDDDVIGIGCYTTDDAQPEKIHLLTLLADQGPGFAFGNHLNIVYNFGLENQQILHQIPTVAGSNEVGWKGQYITLCIQKKKTKVTFRASDWNSDALNEEYTFVLDLNAHVWGQNFTKSAYYCYGAYSQADSYFQTVSFKGGRETTSQYQVYETKLENKDTLYHKIDDSQPDDNMDIYIGSVYIRQNTSLESTILVDTRIRGGGVLESMKDSIRHELEPESDWYLDIGYYDGKPYQENGVVVVRIDRRLLKEYGGRFTREQVSERVNRWLAYGVVAIIEYVNAYSKYELPQHTLEVEDSYSNVVDEILDIYPECVLK